MPVGADLLPLGTSETAYAELLPPLGLAIGGQWPFGKVPAQTCSRHRAESLPLGLILAQRCSRFDAEVLPLSIVQKTQKALSRKDVRISETGDVEFFEVGFSGGRGASAG